MLFSLGPRDVHQPARPLWALTLRRGISISEILRASLTTACVCTHSHPTHSCVCAHRPTRARLQRRIHTYVCMHRYVCIPIRACTCTYKHVFLGAHVHAHAYTILTCTSTCAHIHTDTHSYSHVYMHSPMCIETLWHLKRPTEPLRQRGASDN